jgi:multidrug resistance protein, MATE family
MGHLDNADILAGVGLGTSINMIGFFAVTQGLNGTLETFVSQYYGAGELRMCGVYLNRARFSVTVVMLPLTIIILFVDKILVGTGQDP